MEVRRNEDGGGGGGGGGGEGRTWKLGEIRVVDSFPDGAGGRRPPLTRQDFPGSRQYFLGQPRPPVGVGEALSARDVIFFQHCGTQNTVSSRKGCRVFGEDGLGVEVVTIACF